MPRLREKQRLRELRLLGIKPGIPIYIPPELIARGFKLKFYDTSDVKIGEIGSDVKTGKISTVNFELMGLGCAAFSFVIDEMPKLFKYEIDVGDESLVCYWPLDETSGMVAYDISLYGNDGALINMEEEDHVPGKINNGLILDGVNECVQRALFPHITSSGTYSILIWGYWKGDTGIGGHESQNVWLNCNGPWDRNGLTITKAGLLGFQSYDGVYNGRKYNNFPQDEWVLVVCVQKDGVKKLYINAEEVGYSGNNYQLSGSDFRISHTSIATNGYGPFYGLVDEFLTYNRALTAAEVKALYELKVGKHIDAFDMAYRTRVDIHPYFDPLPWFTGFIQTLPQQGQKKPFEYSGFGFFDQLDWVTVTGSYENQDVAVIVKDIIQNTVAPNTQIIYNASKVQSPSYTVVKIDFDHTLAKDAIQTLADMAQGYEFGVDGSREFYFRPIDTAVHHSYWMGKHFQDAEIEKNPFTVRNKLYIKIGEIQAGGSNIIGSVQDNDSITAHGLREEVINVPESLNPTDAQRWAADILARMKDPEVKAKIKSIFLDESKTKIEAKGKVKITAHDGTEYTFFIKRVAYAISPEGILGDVELE